jgi:hypothetical protein
MKKISSNAFLHACIPPLLIFFFAAKLLWLNNSGSVSLLLVVFLTGAAGGVISNYFRIRELPEQNIGTNAIIQIYVTPLISGLLSWVSYAICLSGFLQGSLFPAFAGSDAQYENLEQMFSVVKPDTTLDVAKVLLWSFVAGFFEKFIPNILDKIAGEVENQSFTSKVSTVLEIKAEQKEQKNDALILQKSEN